MHACGRAGCYGGEACGQAGHRCDPLPPEASRAPRRESHAKASCHACGHGLTPGAVHAHTHTHTARRLRTHSWSDCTSPFSSALRSLVAAAITALAAANGSCEHGAVQCNSYLDPSQLYSYSVASRVEQCWCVAGTPRYAPCGPAAALMPPPLPPHLGELLQPHLQGIQLRGSACTRGVGVGEKG